MIKTARAAQRPDPQSLQGQSRRCTDSGCVIYMMERFLERISFRRPGTSSFSRADAGGCPMVGLDACPIMDIDATVKGATVGIEEVENMIASIISRSGGRWRGVPCEAYFRNHGRAEYPGIRVSMETEFDGVITPLKIDISTGDAITPREVRYSFKLMLEDRSIEIWAYNLETVLAESWKPMCPVLPPTPA